MTLPQNTVPPTLNLDEPGVNVKFNLVPKEAQQRQVNAALTNSFGFGGTNATLVFSKYHG